MQDSQPVLHLIVLIHGLFGTHRDFDVLSHELEVATGGRARGVLVHATAANDGLTLDGIERGAERAADDVCALLRAHGSVATLSLVGHSLGGLYARRAARILDDRGVFDLAPAPPAAAAGDRAARRAVAPAVFATIASPHLGAGPRDGPLRAAFGLGAGVLARLSRTVHDVTMAESEVQLLQGWERAREIQASCAPTWWCGVRFPLLLTE